MLCRESEPECCMMYPIRPFGICILFISLCLLRLSTLVSLAVLKLVKEENENKRSKKKLGSGSRE